MIILQMQEIPTEASPVRVRVYLEGSGDPSENHQIIAFSVNERTFGPVPNLEDVSKFEDINR